MSPPFIRLRKALDAPPQAPVWPDGVRQAAFGPDEAEAVYALLAGAYARGGGRVGPFADWWKALRTDAEYDPALVLLAVDGDGVLAGVAQSWTSGFVKDLVVAEGWRRRGLGAALLRAAFVAFHARGAAFVDLKVEADNPWGAERLYRREGMMDVVQGETCA
ncbi:MAG: GNAT family N-acetyltransferase [Caulobacter sp.]|nr:GNAT family N-acetyltransferase [Caulobacter sp.]